ncbi:lipopolysaccharide biosynthesis protein [Hoylesella loescheii]|jgi:capsular polysaccharide repeat unit transporter|uniref:lipopolysaccharide biosynthesis protein n=1 Tax=Hoylesella loescheii TaxID=840 RepID=UPI0026EF6BB6|nr:lipopolysaccharide biosynthesis protein [Hoylesella loescheii]
MSDNLKVKAARGLFWSSVDRFSSQGISFVFSIFLARILDISDYGIVAMIVVFMAVAQAFVDSGFSSALIRKPDLNEEDKSTAFYFNIVVGLACYGILFITSPLIADFYDEPLLSPIIRVTGLSIVFNSLCVVQRALFTIAVDFKTQAIISLACTVISGVVGLVMAYNGYGVWALVAQSTVSTFFNFVLLWLCSRWRPVTRFSKASFRYLFNFGSKLLASGLLDTLYNNAYPIVIGKFYNSAQLGLYSRAQSYASLPSSNITGILQRVTFPVLSLMQDDDERLALNYRRLLRVSAFVVFPLMVMLAAVAAPLIRVMITSKWDGCVGFLQILSLAMMWYPIHAINLNLLQVKGRSDLFLRLEIYKKILGVLILICTIPLGVTAMCWGLVVGSVFSLVMNTYYTGKLIKVGFFIQMKDLLPTLVNSVIMGGIAYYIVNNIDSSIISLIAACSMATAFYFTTSYLLKFPELKEVLLIIKRK